ncbi:MAG: SDR family oxidoreductase [Porticoccaceae bacterium]|nr:SDR family oxidoreductase [Porticoccaceae bacterium]
MENFNDKTVLITGAASGLGKAAAMLFARAGASLSLVDINGDRLGETAREIVAEGGREPLCHVLDLTGRETCHKLVADTVDALGGLDVLCNIAGILGASRIEDISENHWDKMLAVNLSAPFWLSQAAMPHLLESGGNIVNVASAGGMVGQAYLVPYSTTKAALIHMTRSMAMEMIKSPVRINAIAPGGMITNITESGAFPEDADPELVGRYAPTIRPPVAAEQVADLVVYLASDRAANIHGACLSSDGGMTAG